MAAKYREIAHDEEKIKLLKAAFAYSGMSQAEVARSIGITPANFNYRLLHSCFTENELQKIAEAIGAEFVPAAFVFPDGRRF